eukprot:CAMPEP_0184464942 /NCGR_PEP_ID=MMETSP0740-20130409/59507_1 /TAXON_ID=385413 /ORGANISM="Thalassiosira miniscula, Strain CCMP1093" /LENGTH=140 /DNA_ID=CAMNT_0026839597 /DNA_START=169 /DNA_END=591 /DNA_ORIENTATION=-
MHFCGAQRGARIGGKVWVSGPRRKDHDAAFFHVTDRTAADEGFANLIHPNAGLDAGLDTDRFERALHTQRIHNRREHAHRVSLRALHALRRTFHPAEDVPAPDHQTNLNTELARSSNFLGEAKTGWHMNSVVGRPHQSLT